MLQSNKRTAGLPSPHPTVLQSCCSTQPGSQAVLGHSFTQDPHPTGTPTSWAVLDPCSTKTPAPWATPDPLHQDPCPSISCPSIPQPLSSTWDYWSHAPLGSPPLWVGDQLGLTQLHSPAHQDPCPLGGTRP
jgi:hypothetical protein